MRLDQSPLVALRHVVKIGNHVAEPETWRDEIDRRLDSTKRIEV